MNANGIPVETYAAKQLPNHLAVSYIHTSGPFYSRVVVDTIKHLNKSQHIFP